MKGVKFYWQIACEYRQLSVTAPAAIGFREKILLNTRDDFTRCLSSKRFSLALISKSD